MLVVKPAIVGSPVPLTDHWDDGLPGREFSQTMGLRMGGVHGFWANAERGATAEGAMTPDPTPRVIARTTATQKATFDIVILPQDATRYPPVILYRLECSWSRVRGRTGSIYTQSTPIPTRSLTRSPDPAWTTAGRC